MFLFLFFIVIGVFFSLFCVQYFCLVGLLCRFCPRGRVFSYFVVTACFRFRFVVYLSFAKPLLVLATDFSVWLMLFYVLIICLHFVVLFCCGGFTRAALFCVVFLLPLAPLLVICVVVGLRRILCVL